MNDFVQTTDFVETTAYMQIKYIYLHYFYFSMYIIGNDIALSFKKIMMSCYLDDETDVPASPSPIPLEERPSIGK